MMKPGKYWIGDLCYVMHDEWDEFCGQIESGGEYTLKDGRQYAWQNTAYGDGEYHDNFGNSYGVDAGLIGCILLSDIEANVTRNDISLGHVYEFNQEFECTYDEGVIKFGNEVSIDTIGYDEEYDEDEDEY